MNPNKVSINGFIFFKSTLNKKFQKTIKGVKKA